MVNTEGSAVKEGDAQMMLKGSRRKHIVGACKTASCVCFVFLNKHNISWSLTLALRDAPLNHGLISLSLQILFYLPRMQDRDFPNCMITFALWSLRDGPEKKEDVVWYSIDLRISPSRHTNLSLRIDFRGWGMSDHTVCQSRWCVRNQG